MAPVGRTPEGRAPGGPCPGGPVQQGRSPGQQAYSRQKTVSRLRPSGATWSAAVVGSLKVA